MPFFLSAIGNEQQLNANGSPLSGGKINTYAAGTTTRVATYTDKAGATEQANPIILNTLGLPANPIWLKGGVSYKFVITDSADVVQRTVDDITGTNDPAVASSVDQWVLFTAVPTFISATSFSLAGDQTNTFQVNRRVKSANTGGTGHHTITASTFAAGITTVTVTNDSVVLDTGLSAVSYGLLSVISPSVPATYAKSGANSDITSLTILPGYLFGCTLSTAGSSATMSIAAGKAQDSTGGQLMALTAVAKTTSAWAVGTASGGLDAGAIANSTWYHFYVIRRPDTGVVDVVFSTNATTPTLPANYTQYRYIGSGLTNGSAQWTSFSQNGDEFLWLSSVLDVNGVTPNSTVAQLVVIRVPPGVKVNALLNSALGGGGVANNQMLISSPDVSDVGVSLTGEPLWSGPTAYNIGNGSFAAPANVRTNASAQIRYRLLVASAATTVYIVTLGYINRRGRDA